MEMLLGNAVKDDETKIRNRGAFVVKSWESGISPSGNDVAPHSRGRDQSQNKEKTVVVSLGGFLSVYIPYVVVITGSHVCAVPLSLITAMFLLPFYWQDEIESESVLFKMR